MAEGCGGGCRLAFKNMFLLVCMCVVSEATNGRYSDSKNNLNHDYGCFVFSYNYLVE